MIKRGIKTKSLLAKWLLISTLFVSLFGFTAPAGQSSLQQQKALTELVFSKNVKSSYRAAGYECGVVIPQSALKRTCVQYREMIFAYGRLSKVKFDQLLRSSVFIPICCLFHHRKTIPQSSGDDNSAFLLG